MALTMTRPRTQTALTKLVELVANVHGELETVEGLLATAWAEMRDVTEGGLGRGQSPESPEAALQQSTAVQQHDSSVMPQHKSSAIAGRLARPTARDAARVKGADQRRAALERRRQVLLAQRDSLYATVRQFDAELDPTSIGATQDWLKQYGRGGGRTALARYLRFLETGQS